MELIWPSMLLLFLVIPLLILFYLRVDARRQKASVKFGTLGIAAAGSHTTRRHIPYALWLIALLLLILAAARPEMVVRIPRAEGMVILLFDVSGSMAADDLEPTRMEAAKAAARTFVEGQPSTVEIGVVSFSEGGIIVQIPTNDEAEVIAAIDRLSPQNATSLGNGIYAALNTIAVAQAGDPQSFQLSDYTPMPTTTPLPVPAGSTGSVVIVLLTDGENTSDPDPLEAAQAAADRGIRVYTVGIGSAEGAVLELDGFAVFTALDETTLQQIALMTDADYYNAQTTDELTEIYANLRPELVIEPETMEITSILAGFSILIMLLGSLVSFMWFNRMV